MGFKRLERALTAGFRWYGEFVGRRPVPFILVPFVITIALTPGFFFIRNDDDVISLFTPYNAPSRYEQRVVKEFSYVQPLAPVSSPGNDPASHVTENDTAAVGVRYLLQSAKNKPKANPSFFVDVSYANESNILNVQTFHMIWQFVDYMYNNFSCQVQTYPDQHGASKTRTLRYNPDFCNPNDSKGYECPKMDKQIGFLEELLNKSIYDTNENSKIRLTYPVMYIWNRPINWGHFLYGAKVNTSNGKILSARLASLKFQFQFDLNDENTYLAKQCMRQMRNFVLSLNDRQADVDPEIVPDKSMRFYVNYEWFINEEVAVVKSHLMPCVAITTLLVTLFTTVSSYYAQAPLIGAIEALLGVLTIGLSLSSTLSLLFLCGLSFNFVITITLTITLCVGIDNDFLLISAWRRPHLEGKPGKERLALSFAEAGPSLTITSINDILCFAVGYISESPAISDFCLFTCVALTLRYLYQLTFFSGALVYVNEKGPPVIGGLQRVWRKYIASKRLTKAGKMVHDTPDQRSGSPSVSSDRSSDNAITVPMPNSANHSQMYSSTHTDQHVMHQFFRHRFSYFISRPWVRFVVTVLFAVYMAASFVLAAKLKVNISITKLFLDQSPLIPQSILSQRYVLTNMIGGVIVTRPPDFRNSSNVDRFLNFVDALERTPLYSPDPQDTTVLWLRDYLDFSSYIAEPGSDFYEYLSIFLERDEYSKFINDIRFNYSQNGRIQVESFMFTTYYQNATTWDDCANILLLWRSVCQNYSDYGAIVHDYFFRNSYLDQRLTLAHTTLQTMGIASLSIAVVTALLMPDAASMFFICFSLFSVDLGVIAALNTWGSDLDPITMACLLMTIGFSVYYTARICYCYQRADKRLSVQSKLAYTLGVVGWPILQGGLATLVGIIPLAFIPAYMVRTFFRTIILVVFIGLLHGLLFMPVLMSLHDRHYEASEWLESKRREIRKLQESERLQVGYCRNSTGTVLR